MGALGNTLRERRISLGLSIQQVEATTNIRARLIEALEDGDYERLPDPGYIRGYVSSYARLMELDPNPLLQLLKAETGRGRFHQLDLPQIDEAVAPTGQQHAVPSRIAWIAAAVLAVAALGVWVAVNLVRGPEPTPPDPTPPQTTGTAPAEGDVTTSGPAGATESSVQPALETTPFAVEVTVEETGASWIRITIDGKRAYEGTLAGGQKKTYQATTDASVLIGKPSVVTVLRDGKPVKIPDGDTPTVEMTAETPE